MPVVLAALAAAAGALWATRRPGRRHRREVAGLDGGELAGLAAELRLRGVDARVERALDLTVEPGVERLLLDYPERDGSRVERHLGAFLAARVGRGAPERGPR